MSALVVLNLFPDVLNIHGDAENAAVLAARARWAGAEAAVHNVLLGEPLPGLQPDIVVLGSGADEDLARVLDALDAIRDSVVRWVVAGIPILAVGTGWELLGRELETADGTVLAGLGVFPGSARPAASRSTGELVIDSEHGRLLGFEYRTRDYVAAVGEASLGSVIWGVGNAPVAAGRGLEGSVWGAAIGTHLHGPVLASNPTLADHLLSRAAPNSDWLARLRSSVGATPADQLARSISQRRLVALKL